MLDKVDLLAAAGELTAAWVPETVAAYNGSHVQVVRVEGTFVWHSHEGSDNLFVALDEPLRIELRERTIELARGELFVVPAGVEHRLATDAPRAHVMCVEDLGHVEAGEYAPPELSAPFGTT